MEFKDIQNTWQQQSEQTNIPDFTPTQQKLQKIRKEQRITQFILGITGIVLIAFFFYISAYKFSGTLLGMSLLIGVIIIRVWIEVKSRQTLRKINVLLSLEDFKAQLISYYENRKKLAFTTIPILLIVYNIGVGIMMYYFYQYISRGFFYYIVISYAVSFVVLFYFIRKQVLQELKTLKSLQEA
ncbi:hypothetical protein C8N46_10632 [Kordia periserrulae]|uniref:Uncharacterized protein n=1 Tax=Kordia periserrulae TaxID=701523 RepID=A0A2T6BWC8_9FLAO|nr:hypothetical protein [Kordia periserrulae]PTX60388.1 hypothetical protein C8N46_10632 [Kordia periserrulae]